MNPTFHGWSANSLFSPAFHRGAKLPPPAVPTPIGMAPGQTILGQNAAPAATDWVSRILGQGTVQKRYATQGPNMAFGNQILGQPAQVNAAQPAATPAQPVVLPAQVNAALPVPPKITQPGIDPTIATAVPQAPSTGIPAMISLSGWQSPGGVGGFRSPKNALMY